MEVHESKQSRRVCASAHTSPLAATGAFPFVSHRGWPVASLTSFSVATLQPFPTHLQILRSTPRCTAATAPTP